MAWTSASFLHAPPISPRVSIRCLAGASAQTSHAQLSRRRSLLLLFAAPVALPLLAEPRPSLAQDIPLFGLRKRLQVIEKEAEEIVKEGEKVVEEGIEAAEKELKTAEEEIVEAEAGFQVAGDLLQAATVAAAEGVGVLVGVTVVNGILGPEGQEP